MRNYIILNGQSSANINGLLIQELAPISKPQQRTQVETIDGRDGDIVTPLGFAAYNKKVSIGLYGSYDIDEVIEFFNSEGQVTFSNEPDKYYNYQILDQIDYERLVRFRVATVTMHVQPFKYSATEGTLTIDASDTVSGEGSEIALDNTAEAPFNVLRYKGNIEQTTYTGKNLFNATGGTASASGVTFTRNADGTYTANGKATAFIGYTIGTITFPTATSVTYNGCPSGGAGSTYSINLQKVNGGVWLTDETGSGQTATLEANEAYSVRLIIRSGVTVNNIVYKPMVRLSSISDATYEPYVGGTASPNPDYPQAVNTATGENVVEISDGQGNEQSYEVNLGALELCKIGTHQDRIYKNDGKWYIEKQTGKAAIDTSAITQIGNYSNIEYATTAKPSDFAGYGNYQNIGVLCSHATYQDGGDSAFWNQSSNAGHMYTRADNRVFWVGFAKGTGLNAMKTALANCIIYYPLATPTDEEITDQDLIDALDEFYGQAHSYKGHTHIAATAEGGNAPAILSVEVGEDNESTITNAGNTTSRPILTIYGQGDIGVYINDVEVLDIALGNEQYITIDSVAMEAYKGTTANLKNRLVTGDYSKLALNAGDNKIYFTGTVTKYEISKYSRWL